jgi:long-chain acyl-CoA synthetase
MSVGVCFQSFADVNPSTLAVVDTDGERWNRGQFASLINRIAQALLAAGLSKEDSIAIVAPNCAEFLAVYLAGVQVGLYIVPVNWHLAPKEVTFVLDDCKPRAIFAHARLSPKVLEVIAGHRGCAELLVSIGPLDGFEDLTELIAETPESSCGHSVVGRLMAYTSATTGFPKAVRLPVANAEKALERFIGWNHTLGIALEDDNVHLCCSMLYHSAPLLGATVALHMGHVVVLMDYWRPELMLKLIESYRVTTIFLVPQMFVRLLKLDKSVREKYSTVSLRFVVHGGAPCPIEVKRRMIEWWGNVIWESYGASEGQGTIVGSEDWLRNPGTVGRPVPGSDIIILDEHGREQVPNAIGAIYMRPFTGDRFEYKDDPEKTRLCYCGDYITVGDVGYLNEDGYLFICARDSELIISSGMNIYPAEIECVLVQHPSVTDCAVVGISHDVLGAVPKAYVQAEPGVEPGHRLTADLLAYLGAHLAPAKVPKRIEYVERIPRDPNGKLYKRLLKGGIRAQNGD